MEIIGEYTLMLMRNMIVVQIKKDCGANLEQFLMRVP